MADLRVGMVGSGWVATDRYLPVLRRQDQVTIVGLADRNLERAISVADAYGVPAYTDAAELIELRPDVVFVCTSPFSHASITTAALQAGVHVFVEKPMALDNTEAAEMVAAAENTGRKLGVSHNLLFSRSVQAVRKRIDSGELGEVRHVYALQASSLNRRLPHWYPELRGGLFFDESPHMIYLLDSLLGGLSVDHAWSENSDRLTALSADFVGTAGVRGQLTMVFDSPISEWFITIVCDKGVAVLDLFRDIQFVVPPDGGHRPLQVLRTSLAAVLGHGLGSINTGARYLSRRQFWGHDVIIEDFLDAVRYGKTPAVTGVDGARVVAKMIEVLDTADR